MRVRTLVGLAMVATLLLCGPTRPALAQIYSKSITASYEVETNVTYVTFGGWTGKLDVYPAQTYRVRIPRSSTFPVGVQSATRAGRPSPRLTSCRTWSGAGMSSTSGPTFRA